MNTNHHDRPPGRKGSKTMTKFEKTMRKAETLQRIYEAIQNNMKWIICWEDEENLIPADEEEGFKYEVYQEVFKALEKMI